MCLLHILENSTQPGLMGRKRKERKEGRKGGGQGCYFCTKDETTQISTIKGYLMSKFNQSEKKKDK